jgi:hypothetical protein
MITPAPASAIKKKIYNNYGSLLNFSLKFDINRDTLYRCFNAPYTRQKLIKLLEIEKMIDTDPTVPISKIKAKRLIKIYFKSVYAFCCENSFTYSHVIRYLEGTITRLHPPVEEFILDLKNKHDEKLNLESV